MMVPILSSWHVSGCAHGGGKRICFFLSEIKHKHVIDLVLLLLDVTKFVFG